MENEFSNDTSPMNHLMAYIAHWNYIIAAAKHMNEWKRIHNKPIDEPHTAEFDQELENFKSSYDMQLIINTVHKA